jgi:signal transduction histidine kinase
LHDSSSLLQEISSDDWQSGIVYGVSLFLIFQGMVLWLYFRERIYGHYLGYSISTLLIMFISDGTFRLFFLSAWFDEVYFTTYFILPICFYFVFSIVFDLLNTRTLFPKLVKWTWFFILLSLVFSFSNAIGFFFAPSYPLIIYRVTTLVVLSYPILFVIICLKTYFHNRNYQSLVLLALFSLVLIFMILFAFLPFINYQFERFMSFKWMILFEGASLMLIINRDLYLNKIAKIRLLEDLNEQKELVTQRYLEGLLDERKRIASDLHDGLSAKISAYKIQLSGFKFSDNEQKTKALAHLDEVHQEIRNASHALSPILLNDRGIKQILEDFILKIEDSDLDLIVDYSFELTENQIRSPHKEILYFTVLELINNVLKHAHAKNLKIQLTEQAHTYVLMVEDDGVGYKSNGTQSAGIGIKRIQQRAEFFNGKFQNEHLINGVKHTCTIQKKSPENQ